MIDQIINIAKKAGDLEWELFQTRDLNIKYKADNSPVTVADKQANDLICSMLPSVLNLPIISEESVPEYSSRTDWKTYWLVDPLDGTKGFINGSGEFTVNIALLENSQVTAGVIYYPKDKACYWATKGGGAFKNGLQISNARLGHPSAALGSKVHAASQEQAWHNQLGIKNVTAANSSIKFCWIAEGLGDIYLRTKPTMEWDTGAAEIILTEANCKIVSLPLMAAMPRNSESLLNPPFLAYRSNIDFVLNSETNLPTLA